MNESILDRLFEEVLEEFPELNRNYETRKVAGKIAYEMFLETGM